MAHICNTLNLNSTTIYIARNIETLIHHNNRNETIAAL